MLNIKKDKIDNFSIKAAEHFTSLVNDYAIKLKDEIYRLELARSNDFSEIDTISIGAVKEAVEGFEGKYYRRKADNKKKYLILEILAMIFSLLSGIIFKKELLEEQWYVVVYLIVFALFIIFNVLSLARRYKW